MSPQSFIESARGAAPEGAAPANLHISVTSRASDAPRLRERMEQKFFVRPERLGNAMALLFRVCRRDPLFPDGQVNSLYFDTFDLEEHLRSDAGDSAKDKIRIRWYGDEFDPHRRSARSDAMTETAAARGAAGWPPGGPACAAAAQGSAGPPAAASQTVRVWPERKTRRGFASTKQRASLEVPGLALAFSALGRGIVSPALLVDTMAGFGYFPPKGRFCPVIAISYSRYRFVEPVTGFRISIDWRIRSSLVMPGLGRGARGLELPGAIVEVKGHTSDVPPALQALVDIGSTWTRFSKYSSCLEAHAADLGTVCRTWPSGLIERELGHIGRVPAPAEIFERGALTAKTLGLESEA
jgi:hypothetical protein